MDGLKNLPNLYDLRLDLCRTGLGHEDYNLKILRDGIKNLYNKRKLNLLMDGNFIGENLKYLGEGFRYLANLEDLRLSLNRNQLGKNLEYL